MCWRNLSLSTIGARTSRDDERLGTPSAKRSRSWNAISIFQWFLISVSRHTLISSIPVSSWNWRICSVCSFVSTSSSIIFVCGPVRLFFLFLWVCKFLNSVMASSNHFEFNMPRDCRMFDLLSRLVWCKWTARSLPEDIFKNLEFFVWWVLDCCCLVSLKVTVSSFSS